jgi:exonuclease III/ribonuclease HI
MKILSWNCRGLGSPRAVRALLRLTRVENPQIVFLMETRLKVFEMDAIRNKMGFHHCLSVDCRGSGRDRAGGLSLMWTENQSLSVTSFSLNHIHSLCSDEETGEQWGLTGIYGFPEEHNKWKTWRLLEELAEQIAGRWLCCGDFNDILDPHDKQGGNDRSQPQLTLARQAVSNCHLIDLGFEGYPFTWSNKRGDEANIQCRIDRAMGNEAFVHRFSPIKVKHLPRFGSDHAAILIGLEAVTEWHNRRRKRLFRFEESWSKDSKCEDLIRQNWNNSPGTCLEKIGKLKHLGTAFDDHDLGKIKKELGRIERLLTDQTLWDGTDLDRQKLRDLEKQHAELLARQETMWRQRSRAVWLRDGDKNTKFFHNKASQRSKDNGITKIKDGAGVWKRGTEQIERVLISYFEDLFSSSSPSNIEETCAVVKGKLSDDHKRWCEMEYTEAEINEALHQMHPLKAPGPDGLPALFYQKYWHIVGTEVRKLVLNILNHNEQPHAINNTFVVLIPKGKNPSSPKDYRPISLCNVVMKIVTKVIANRLKQTLPDVVDMEQSAFVQGRWITDNALIAMECFHWLKKKKKGKKGTMALKLDMSKAYDRIEWPFVHQTLTTMGYPPKMVDLIMRCISSVSYQLLINGQPSSSFSPERGLRQGDPLSPYLFILCADVLSGLLHKAVSLKEIHGIKVARTAPLLSHLLFADDSLLFTRANTHEANKILSILATYQQASGQVVNLDKTEASFSRNVPNEDKHMICNMMGVKAVEAQSRYLGFPIPFGRSKKVVFSFVMDRIWKKVKGWKERFLNKAGKETLIKAVAQAIPNYILSCYKMPVGCCRDIDMMLARFWWGSNDDKRKIHWVSWEKLSKSKNRGGMGFRGMSEFNKALLGKHCWRLTTGTASLLEKVFKSRYYPNGNFSTAKEGYQPSYAWKSILSARNLVETGGLWRVGNGRAIRIGKDNWVPDMKVSNHRTASCSLENDGFVSDLIDEDTKQWKRDLIFSSFDRCLAQKIVSIPLSARLPPDSLSWQWERDGSYSVRSAYHLVCGEKERTMPGPSRPPQHKVWKEIWKAQVPNKIKNFMWRLAKNVLPTRENLSKKGIDLDKMCPLCYGEVESTNHLFMQCNLMRLTLFASHLGSHMPFEMDLHDWILSWLTCQDMLGSQLFCTILWKFWTGRNNTVFQGINMDPPRMAEEALNFVAEFNEANPRRHIRTGMYQVLSQPPLNPPLFSLFVDAGCFSNGCTGWGAAIHDQDGRTILSCCCRENISVEPLLAEALGVRWAIQVALEQGITSISINLDALNVVNCLNNKSKFAAIELVVQDCKELMKGFSNVVVQFVSRELNVEAHTLASLARNVGSKSWLGLVPPDLFHSVNAVPMAVNCIPNDCVPVFH